MLSQIFKILPAALYFSWREVLTSKLDINISLYVYLIFSLSFQLEYISTFWGNDFGFHFAFFAFRKFLFVIVPMF